MSASSIPRPSPEHPVALSHARSRWTPRNAWLSEREKLQLETAPGRRSALAGLLASRRARFCEVPGSSLSPHAEVQFDTVLA